MIPPLTLLCPSIWGYLLAKPRSWRAFWCRFREHPAGVVYYSQGWEPDMHCKHCGDDLG